MSLIRPELRALLWRWREVALFGAIILWAARLLGRGIDKSSLTQAGFATLVLGVCAYLLYHAVLRATLAQSGTSAGAVVISEREIGFMGPESGSFVSLDDLSRLEILIFERASAKPDMFWSLSQLGGDALMIPLNAQGADQLFDSFAALPGVRLVDATRAVAQAKGGRFLIWEKPH